MTGTRQLVTFSLDGTAFGIDAAAVERVFRAVAVTPLPGAPAVVAGVVDVHGTVVPVVDTRAAFGFPARRLRASDQFIVAAGRARSLALIVDAVGDVLDADGDAVVPGGDVGDGLRAVGGVLPTASGIVLVGDVDALLTPAEDAGLAQAEEARRGDG